MLLDPERQCSGTYFSLHKATKLPAVPDYIHSAKVIEYLQQQLRGNRAVIYCFFDYARRHELTTEAVLANLLVQLCVRNQEKLCQLLQNLYKQCEEGRRRPTMSELKSAFQNARSEYEGITVVLDALDESEHSVRRQLISILDITTAPKTSLLAFGRTHVDSKMYVNVEDTDILEIEIAAHRSDLNLFLRSRIEDNQDLDCVARGYTGGLSNITERIIKKAQFRYVDAIALASHLF